MTYGSLILHERSIKTVICCYLRHDIEICVLGRLFLSLPRDSGRNFAPVYTSVNLDFLNDRW